MKLTDEQVEEIRRYVENNGITIPTLKDDLVDHLSCVVEREMDEGKSFVDAFGHALAEVAPKGLEEIQDETVLLFNPTHIIFMKKTMYLIGLISSIALALGWLFNVLHWPGGYELFNYGLLGFLLLFVPMLAIDRFRVSIGKGFVERTKILLGGISALMVGISLVFKLLHLQGADFLLVAGMVLFAFGFLPFLFFTNYRKAISPSDSHKE